MNNEGTDVDKYLERFGNKGVERTVGALYALGIQTLVGQAMIGLYMVTDVLDSLDYSTREARKTGIHNKVPLKLYL